MKKLICMILILVTVVTGALACEDVLPKEEASAAYTLKGDVLLPLEADTRELLGHHDYKAKLEVYPVSQGQIVRGIVEDGVLHIKGAARVMVTECGQVLGLTRIHDIWYEVDPEDWELVAGIVLRRTGEELTDKAGPMAAAMQYRVGDTIREIFFRKDQVKEAVGTMHCNGGRDVAVVYAGDYDEDGMLELGLVDGSGLPKVQKVQKEEPEDKDSEKQCKTVVVTRTVTEQTGGIDISIRIGTFVRTVVTTCVKVFKMCCGK